MGDAWLKTHGSKLMQICIVGGSPCVIERDELNRRAMITIASCQLGQVETLALLTRCDSAKELGKIKKVLAMGFATEGRPRLDKRFYCQDTGRWVVPVGVNLRLFYDLLE